ncbi:helix-turn-helix domain-containing protein [Streptomyces marincola]|uniref:helix-turn-helix domain-containing protein n=1 Tax=Streptomyces marincola TaxID=2878388 RepID=UPI001CF47579|nr:helix-turn-helix transcriptional regulator [Streptomyces marincola]UCM91148.1 helix-turn-helix domain-containing protein [Streptomyces marincola]
MSSAARPAPGARLAQLRKERHLTQDQLAAAAAISKSLLSKIEVGDRPLTPATAAALGKAMGLSMADVQGLTPPTPAQESVVDDLRAAMRDYDLPRKREVSGQEVRQRLRQTEELRNAVDLARLMPLLPGLLRDATSHAHRSNTSESWALLGEVYSVVYWLAARHRWLDMAEVAVARETWAAEQMDNPLFSAVAARDRAGTYLNFGDCENGLVVVERAISDAESRLSGDRRDIAVGLLNLRGMTLAGRLPDHREARREAHRHMQYAERAASRFSREFKVHGLSFGRKNTFTHRFATLIDLGESRSALALADDIAVPLSGLPATRRAPSFINQARARVSLNDNDGALESLARAWDIAPQLVRIHPMAQEVLRVVDSRHKRSNPLLTRLLELAGTGNRGS